MFSLDGLGYLSYNSLIQRDYPVVLGNVYIFALLGLIVNLISDLTYTWIDPRIDFETREVYERGSASGRASPRSQRTNSRSLTTSERPEKRRPTRSPPPVKRPLQAQPDEPAPARTISAATGAAIGRSGSFSSCSSPRCSPKFIANDRPLVASYKGELLLPVLVDYPEDKFGGFEARTDYRDPSSPTRSQRMVG